MGKTIKTSDVVSAVTREVLARDVDAYCGLRLCTLAWALPCAGSQDHDARLLGGLADSLAAYRAMVTGDVAAAEALEATFAQADAALAHSFGVK